MREMYEVLQGELVSERQVAIAVAVVNLATFHLEESLNQLAAMLSSMEADNSTS